MKREPLRYDSEQEIRPHRFSAPSPPEVKREHNSPVLGDLRELLEQKQDDYTIRGKATLATTPPWNTSQAEPTLFEARVTQLLPTDRFLVPKTEDKLRVVRRIVDMLNMNTMNDSARMTVRRLMKLHVLSVADIVRNLVSLGYSHVSVESVRAIVQDNKKTIVMLPDSYHIPALTN